MSMEELLRQFREDTNRRLVNIEQILQRFLVIEDRVNHQGEEIAYLKEQVIGLESSKAVSKYRRDWTDRVVQTVVAGAGISVIGAALTFIIGV